MVCIDRSAAHRQTVCVTRHTLTPPRPSVLTLSLVFTFMCLQPDVAHSDEGKTIAIDERTEEDSAASTSVIARDELQHDMSHLGEVLDRQAGARITRLGGLGSYASASIRGSSAEQVLVLLEGVPLLSTEGGPFDLAMLPLGLIKRITLTRGTSPAAFGTSAIGGVIDLKLREARGLMMEVEGGGGSFDTRSGRAFLGFGDGESGGGVALDYQGSAGDFPFTHGGGTAWDDSDSSLSLRANNAFDRLTGLVRGRLVSRGAWSAQLINLLSWGRRGIPGIAIYEGNQATMTTLMNTLGSEVRMDLGWLDGAALRFLPWLTWSESTIDVDSGGLSLGGGSSQAESLNFGARLNLNLPVALTQSRTWMLEPSATLAYRRERYDGQGVVDNPSGALRHRMAAAAQLHLRAEALNAELLLSGRFEGAWTESEEMTSSDSTEGSLRLGLSYAPIEATTLRVNLSQGARFPTPFELFGFTAMTRGNPSLVPEQGLTLDGGIQHHASWLPPGSYASLELSAFASWSQNLIQFVRNSQGISRPQNVAEAFIAGLELGLWLDVASHLRFRGNLTWSHSEDRSEIAARRGKKLPYRPTWKTYARLEAYTHLAGAGEAGLALELEHLEGDVLDHANLVENPARIIFGVASWIEFLESQIRLSLNLRNVMDSKVLDFQGYPLPGPSAMVTLRWRPPLN